MRLLREDADAATAAWWTNYVRGCAPFLGVPMAAIRRTVHTWHAAELSGRLPAAWTDAAFALFQGTSSEEKLAGILYLQEILLPSGALDSRSDLPRFERLFTGGLVFDWNICDWLCVKVLGPLIERDGGPCARAIGSWSRARNLWQARASVVAFVPVADRYHALILRSCAALLERQERFAKTAVGWILREISVSDPDRVLAFAERRLHLFTRESLRNATKYIARSRTERLLKGLTAFTQ